MLYKPGVPCSMPAGFWVPAVKACCSWQDLVSKWGMSSLILVICSVSCDLSSVYSFYTLSTLSHGPGSSQWGVQRSPQGENIGLQGRGSCGVQDKLEWFLFSSEYCPNCLCTLTPKAFKSKAFGWRIVFSFDKLWLLHYYLGADRDTFYLYVCAHTQLCVQVYTFTQ